MRMLNFENTANVIQTIVASDKVFAIQVTDANTVVVTTEVIGATGTAGINVGADTITITATAKAAEVAERLAGFVSATNVGGASVLTVKALTAPFGEVSVVLYAAVV